MVDSLVVARRLRELEIYAFHPMQLSLPPLSPRIASKSTIKVADSLV